MKIYASFIFLTLILGFSTGCENLRYLSKLGWHQNYITFRSVPVQEVLEDEKMDAGVKEKIRFIQEVKRYGEERLGLKRTKSYLKFFETQGPILHVVTACEKDRLQLHTWKFPITGRVSYKSFFTRENAMKEREALEEKGFDTFVQWSGAYSTLGWLKDPIFSSMLEWEEATLANIVLHEMAHATVYFKNNTEFNEQIATFIGNQGSVHFLIEKYGTGSKEVVEAIHDQEDDLLFSKWINQCCQRLSKYYAKEIPRDEKLRGREEIFRSIKEEFKETKTQFKTDNYKGFDSIDLNNAVLLAYRRYIHRLERFEALYQQMGKDLRRVVEFFRTIQASGNKADLIPFLE